jgi:hypothetical protein
MQCGPDLYQNSVYHGVCMYEHEENFSRLLRYTGISMCLALAGWYKCISPFTTVYARIKYSM